MCGHPGRLSGRGRHVDLELVGGCCLERVPEVVWVARTCELVGGTVGFLASGVVGLGWGRSWGR